MMRWGTAVSALGHAAVLTLAIWALPWLRVRPEAPAPALSVSLVSEADLAALAQRAAAAKVPTPEPAPAPVPVRPAAAPRFVAPEQTEPAAPTPAPEDFGLAPAFDPASPLGFPTTAEPAPDLLADAPDPFAEEPVPPPDAAVLRDRHLQALAAAVLRARVYPPAARGGGLMGTARLYLEVARDGSLVEVRLMASSGSASLDRAAVEAARRARLAAAPDDLPGASFAFLQDVPFEAR